MPSESIGPMPGNWLWPRPSRDRKRERAGGVLAALQPGSAGRARKGVATRKAMGRSRAPRSPVGPVDPTCDQGVCQGTSRPRSTTAVAALPDGERRVPEGPSPLRAPRSPRAEPGGERTQSRLGTRSPARDHRQSVLNVVNRGRPVLAEAGRFVRRPPRMRPSFRTGQVHRRPERCSRGLTHPLDLVG